ncbi:hypothetical protein B0T18DRAFT_289025, partial [Schizothecium vesticola]
SSSKKRKSALKEIEVDVSLPEPPSKKAKRLLKKGKTLPAKPQSSDDEANGDDKKKATDKKKERSPYGVWVGNLRFNATKTELRKWFVDNSGGAITDELITRVHMPSTKPGAAAAGKADTKKPSENRGFAYVDFATFEANVAAIALSETELAGRKLLIKDSTSFEGRPKKEEAKEGTAADADEPEVKKSASSKVFVGNLSFQVTEDDLWAHFEKCGKIRWIKVATFEDTGKCKGYGWVNFEEPEAAAWAVKGFVKVKETIDALEDFMDVDEKPAGRADGDDKEESDDDDDDDDDAKAKKASKKKKAVPEAEVRVKTRKWWVNQLLGRPLKIELAEDDQTRYNKRFRGQGAKKRMEEAGGAAPSGENGTREAKEDRKPRVKEPKAIKYASDVNIARLTGAAVASQGKKTTFE